MVDMGKSENFSKSQIWVCLIQTQGKQIIQPRAESQQIAVWRLLY